MAVAINIKYPEGNTVETYQKARETLGMQTAHDGEGLLFHWVEATDDGSFTVHDVWESREQFDAFTESRIAPIAEQIGMVGEPDIEETPVFDYLSPG